MIQMLKANDISDLNASQGEIWNWLQTITCEMRDENANDCLLLDCNFLDVPQKLHQCNNQSNEAAASNHKKNTTDIADAQVVVRLIIGANWNEKLNRLNLKCICRERCLTYIRFPPLGFQLIQNTAFRQLKDLLAERFTVWRIFNRI